MLHLVGRHNVFAEPTRYRTRSAEVLLFPRAFATEPYDQFVKIEQGWERDVLGFQPSRGRHECFLDKVVIDVKRFVPMTIGVQRIHKTRYTLLPIDNPQCVPLLLNIDPQVSEHDGRRRRIPEPKKQSSNGVSPCDAVKEIHNIFRSPPEIALKVRDPNIAFPP